MSFVGLSGLVLGAAIAVRQITQSQSMYGHIQFGTQEDYQELQAFRNCMNDRLDTCLQIANGTYVNYDYLEQNRTSDYSDETAGVAQSVASEINVSGMSPKEYAAYLQEMGYYDGYSVPDSFTPEEEKQMVESYLKYEKTDLNVLYQIVKDGEVLYSNMDSTYRFGNDLPIGYNYLMHFDGKKVHVQKDGKEIDIYGDGIYNENKDYSVPGYSNYQTDDSLNTTAVTLLAVKTPVEYRIAGSNGDSFCHGNTYCLYQDMLRLNNGWKEVLITVLTGMLLLLFGKILSGRHSEWKTKLAAVLNKIWIEPKLLLLLLCLYFVVHTMFAYRDGYSYLQELSCYFSDYGSYGMGTCEILSEMLDLLFGNPLRILLIFWMLYLLLFDFAKNRKKKQKGFLLTLFKGLNDRTLSLGFTRRGIRRVTILILGTAAVLLLYTLCCMLFLPSYGSRRVLLLCFAAFLLLGLLFFWYYRIIRQQAEDLEMLDQQITQISQGNYEPGKMNFSGKDFEKTEENLLHIQNGIQTAVEEQLKSERMKIDLVANVSHDLKTPLTSIISYIQFLKEEPELPAHVIDYVRILDEKSQRLNEMVQDVFSISKATSGQLPVKLEILDFGKLLNQTLADMSETIAKSSINIKSAIREHEFYIEADGQKMYRVCQNLIQNALRYSLEGSRMFISLEQLQNQAVATFKNTSKMELNQDTDFAARFVRGDSSRTDGGSGLGLSIAKSFTEACGGTFTIEINGDMFVVSIAFDQKTSD